MTDQAPCPDSHCINYILIDDLLVEIFYRLPCAELVIQCKCVCKHWRNLISQPGFAARFIAHKINGNVMFKKMEKMENQEEQLPSAYYIRRYNRSACIYPKIPTFKYCSLSLSFIPTYGAGGKSHITVCAWHNDLILCASPSSPYEFDLYLCNPRTKQWIQLPPPYLRKRPYIAGFIYDPHYMVDKETGSVTFGTCRYSVCYGVLRESVVTRLEVEIFSSETRYWRKAVLVSPNYFDYFEAMSTGSFTYNRMMHFYGYNDIIGFDPYGIREDGVIHGHVIEMPPYASSSGYSTMAVGVYGERIRMVQYCARRDVEPEMMNIGEVGVEPHHTDYHLKLWELKSYDTGEWSLDHMVYLHDLVSEDSALTEYIKRGIPGSAVLFFHPYDADTVLLKLHKQIVECNVQQRTLKKVCSTPKNWRCYRFSLPWWPSPIPQEI